tara:strand:- start:2101 stop:2751 length:651 start_codon:yes stop_codon:yes gene_type:complete
MINWNKVFENSQTFKTNKPCPFGFVENIFEPDFYKTLQETYPKIDSNWYNPTHPGRSATKRGFGNHNPHLGDEFPEDIEDKNLSDSWNNFFHYLHSDEFFKNMNEYTGFAVTKLRHFSFIYNKKGDFNIPHTHHEDQQPKDYAYQLTILAYFTKNWPKGAPGGTYISSEEDESTIVFEPQVLDNSWICFAETPNSWHGSRYQTHDIPRPSIQFTLT